MVAMVTPPPCAYDDLAYRDEAIGIGIFVIVDPSVIDDYSFVAMHQRFSYTSIWQLCRDPSFPFRTIHTDPTSQTAGRTNSIFQLNPAHRFET